MYFLNVQHAEQREMKFVNAIDGYTKQVIFINIISLRSSFSSY